MTPGADTIPVEQMALKPCPFCGQLPLVLPADPAREGDAWTSIRCGNQHCHVVCVVTIHADDTHYSEAAALWNARTEADRSVREALFAATKMLEAFLWSQDHGTAMSREEIDRARKTETAARAALTGSNPAVNGGEG